MSRATLLQLLKVRQPIIYQVASVDFQYSDEAIAECLLKRLQQTGGITFNCAGEVIGMLMDNSKEVLENVHRVFSMTSLLDSLPPAELTRCKLEEETKQLWREQTCVLCTYTNTNSINHDRWRCALFLPCTHLTTCLTCASNLEVCNVCQTPIRFIYKIYRSRIPSLS